MHWSRVAAIVAAVRTALLILAGAACITFGAFLLHPAAGFIVGGVALFVIEFLTSPGQEQERR